MLKKLTKFIVQSILGEYRMRAVVRYLRQEKREFSEADLILDYFLHKGTHGIMIDVGAHFGESFVAYLALRWSVLAFEPDSKNRDTLLANTKGMSFRLFPFAVSDHEADSVAFFASTESDGISSLSAFHASHRETERVRISTLQRVLAEEGVTKVDFLKIDTEGHDLMVLRGFPWSQMQPEVVLCEFEDSKTVPLGYDYRVMGDYLLAQGYQVFLSEWAPIVRYGRRHTWRTWMPYPCTLADSGGWGNFVAFKRDSDLRAVDRYLSEVAKA